MDIKVKGKQVLSGEIYPSGSKNSAVAVLSASLLFDKKLTFGNIPDITDVYTMIDILEKFGSKISWNKNKNFVQIDNSRISFKNLQSDDLGHLRGTSLLWGSMLARFKKVDFRDLPGGCTLGLRPLDTHYLAFRDLGIIVKEDSNSVTMDASKAKSKTIWLNEMSPTATENVIMLATALKGKTKIIGAASEPQVQDLCKFLVKCGVNINGVGSNILEIEGGKNLKPVNHDILSDHYEIATFLALAAVTQGKIKIYNALPGMIENILNVFSKFGIKAFYQGTTLILDTNYDIDFSGYSKGQPLNIKAQPWPGLPVDTLPLFIPIALSAKNGQVIFHNWMYEAGLFWTSELLKLGANIIIGDPHRVIVTAGNKLKGAKLEAPYIIRAVVAMVMAAMISEGESMILDADALYRGHPNFAENLNKLGAKITVIK